MGCQRFAGQVAVITGAASGIGAASARRLAAEGAHVVIADVDGDAGRTTTASINDAVSAIDGAGDAVYADCDVADAGAWSGIRALVEERWGRLDVLHSNAYTDVVAPAHQLEEEGWDRTLAVNLKATYLATRAVIDLLARHEGSIVVTSSVHALIGLPGRPAYAAAKGGLCALARQLAVEYGPAVRVNAVLPGPILTPNWRDVSPADREASSEATVAGRLGTPEEVAATVAFLASRDASYITGASLTVDGGWSVKKESA
ncbi:MAG: SDR family NAD(P)-dependent oxidoreductase [Acidimicrobiales bacterium]